MKYNQKLPVKVEKQLDAYIERIKKIDWFKPKQLDRAKVDSQIKLVLSAFGIEASIEYHCLKAPEDWNAALNASRDASWDAAWDASWDAAWYASRGADDLLASLTPNGEYKKKWPNGNFLQLVSLWEMGLYPVGVVGGKFICYVPDVDEAKVLLDL